MPAFSFEVTMKKLLLLLMVLISLGMTACKDDAHFAIYNYSSRPVLYSMNNGDTNSLATRTRYEETYSLNYSIFSEDTKNILVKYTGDFVFPTTKNIELKAGSSRTLYVFSDAGHLVLRNGYYGHTIDHVYISSSDNTDWGSDLLDDSVISYNETSSWIADPVEWDVKVVYDNGESSIRYNVSIDIEEEIFLTFSGPSKNTTDNKKDGNLISKHRIIPLVK